MGVLSWLMLGAGFGLLMVGAEGLVRGSSGLARRLGISPLVVGLTVVALGTSAPEIAVSVVSAFQGQPDLAVGNVLGSNIFNVLVVLGLSALIAPIVVARQLVRFDVPLMVAVSLVVCGLAWNGRVSRWEGLLLLAALVTYLVVVVRLGRRHGTGAQLTASHPAGGDVSLLRLTFLVVVGLALLVLGSRLLVAGATDVARALGLSELIIGLTILAAGTSLPEVASSVVAALRRENDLAVGNVVGSNLFNLLAVLGLASLPGRDGLPVAPCAVSFDLPVMVAVAVACLPVFCTGHRISRWEGGLFLGYYAVYVLFLFLKATAHDALPLFSGVMLAFVLPLTGITLVVVMVRSLVRRENARREGDPLGEQ